MTMEPCILDAVEPEPSFRVEVIADNTGQWIKNGKTHPSYRDAYAAAQDIRYSWSAVKHIRVVNNITEDVLVTE